MAYVKIFHIVSLFYKAQYRTVHMSFFHILSGYNSWLENISAILESKTGNHFLIYCCSKSGRIPGRGETINP